MAPFDPVSAVVGGALIGLAAVLLMLLNGRIAGISGIFGETLTGERADRPWRLAFLAGLVCAPLLLAFAGEPLPAPLMPSSWAVIVVAALLVGFGTRMSGGCTSGHGVCGLSRLSGRSTVATIAFMATAMVVVAIVRHGPGA